MVSSQTINLDNRAANTIGEIVEGVARVGGEVVAYVRSGVEADTGQADAIKESRLHPVFPATSRIIFLVLIKSGVDDLAGLQHCHT